MKSMIYSGKVMHARKSPIHHSWVFPFCFYAIDLDELPELDRTVRGFGFNRWQPVNLREQDYLRGSGAFRKQLAEFLDPGEIDRIILVTVARFMTKVFNPVSFYYCLRKDGSAAGVVAEVNNTFGERHLYVMGGGEKYPLHHRHEKKFHVSPFNDMNGHYEFSFSKPAEDLNIEIRLVRNDAVVMDAAMWGRGRTLTTGTLWKTMLRHPFNAWMTMPRIVWQAAILHFKKKMPVYSKPDPSSRMTIKEAT
jgi:cyclopropane-fatty-acyl-phospholipid synthase